MKEVDYTKERIKKILEKCGVTDKKQNEKYQLQSEYILHGKFLIGSVLGQGGIWNNLSWMESGIGYSRSN